MTELEGRVTELVSLILDVPAEQLPAGDPQWDSMAHLNIIAALEQELGVQVRPEDSRKLRTIAKICAFLSTRGG